MRVSVDEHNYVRIIILLKLVWSQNSHD